MAFVKIAGIIVFAIGGLWAAQFTLGDLLPATTNANNYSPVSYVGAIALSILAYKGFTTITNSGGEITKPHKNVGRIDHYFIAHLYGSLFFSCHICQCQPFYPRDY